MTIQDESEIKSLLCRERYARDTCQWQKFRNCYHPDPSRTLVDITWYRGDIDEFVSRSAGMASKNVSIMHLVQPADIEIRGFKALAESNGIIMSRFDHEGYDYDFTAWCRFITRLEKVNDVWKLLAFELIYVRDLIEPVPGSPALDFSDIKDWPRKSYRFATWHLKRRGLEVRIDLPGEDDDQTVKQLMDKNLAWFEDV